MTNKTLKLYATKKENNNIYLFDLKLKDVKEK
jgi:hypothetical protein